MTGIAALLALFATASFTGVEINGTGNVNRSGIHTIAVSFDEAVTVSGVAALELTNVDTSQSLDLSAATLSGNGTSTLTWTFTGVTVPNGDYEAVIAAAEIDPQPSEDVEFEFHKLTGDADGSRTVTTADVAPVQANFGQTGGPPFRPGDTSGDGVVSFNDVNTIRANIGQTVD